jgi:peroxiredoxin
LCQHQEAFDELNVEVLILTFGTLRLAQAWMEETCSPFHLLLDPERSVYRAYGLERSLWRSWTLKTIWQYMGLLATGHSWRGIQGDSTQLGGDFVVDPSGIVRLAYRSHDPTDRPSVDQLLDVFRQLAGRDGT